jgi:hypothetical protein
MAAIDISSAGGGGSVSTGVLQLQNGVAMDSTLRNVSDQNNTTSPLKLSTTAVQIESPLRITTSDASGFYLDAEDSATNNRFSIKRDPSSQEVTLDFASNPAGSTTLVGAIRTYQDGVNLSNAMSFIEDGSVGIGTNTPVGILHIKKTAANTRLVIDGDAGFNRLISYRTGAVQRFGLYVNNTAESGSNAGSDFAIRAYSDAGTLLTTPVFIKRSTGNVGIGTTAPTALLNVKGASGIVIDHTADTILGFAQNGITKIFMGWDSANLGMYWFTSSAIMHLSNAGNLGLGGVPLPTARLQVKGSGSTSATDALIVQNSLGTSLFSVRDDGIATFSSAVSGGSFTGIIRTGFINSSGNAFTVMRTNDSTGNATFDQFVAIGTTSSPVATAALEVVSTTKGFLPPRMTNAERAAITSPAVGLMVYCTDAVEGLYVYKSTGWTFVI